MSMNNPFDSETSQKYLAGITDLVNSINEINQKMIQASKAYVEEGYKAYNEHVKSLFTLKNPMEAVELNRKYLESFSSDFKDMTAKRNELFQELVKALGANNNMFNLPESMKDAMAKFKGNGNLDMFKPENWSKFSEMLKFK